jgi:hypothetical protein
MNREGPPRRVYSDLSYVSSPGLVRLFGQVLLIPLEAFVYGLELFITVFQDVRRTTNAGVDVFAGRYVPGDTGAMDPAEPLCLAEPGEKSNMSAENVRRNDKDLHDEMLKLVRYKILFVKREYEYAFPEKEDLVYDDLEAADFSAWKVAEFIQQLADERRAPYLPDKWKNRDYPVCDGGQVWPGDKLKTLPEEDKKYLRVYFEVLERYPREKFKYEELHIDELRRIRKEISPKVDGGC